MSKGLKLTLIILGVGFLLVMATFVVGYLVWKTKGAEWQAQLRESGRQVMAEAAQAGASASKEQCVQLALARLRQDAGFMGQVKVAVFTEHCLDAAKGELSFCADAPLEGEILKTVQWRLKTSTRLGLSDGENGVVKGMQKHCASAAKRAR